MDAKCGTHNTVIPTALATGNCELRTECMVQEILTDAHGRATGVAYFDARDRSCSEQTADLVVVSCGAIESARLLLNSKSPLFPNGLGNRYDWVGRNLQGHTYSGAYGLFAKDIYDDLGPGAFHRDLRLQPRQSGPGRRRACWPTNSSACPIQFVGMVPPGMPRWGQAHKDFMRTAYRRHIAVQGPTQEMPVFDSRVQVDPKVKDDWGIPVARLSGGKHPHTLEIGDVHGGQSGSVAEGGGRGPAPGRRCPGRRDSAAASTRPGTCRMGNDPTDLGGGPVLPRARRGQPLRDRRQRARRPTADSIRC